VSGTTVHLIGVCFGSTFISTYVCIYVLIYEIKFCVRGLQRFQCV
jgi:hypothetical protein